MRWTPTTQRKTDWMPIPASQRSLSTTSPAWDPSSPTSKPNRAVFSIES
jgi:hypothetical protein